MENPARVVPNIDPSFSIDNIIKQVELSGVNLGNDPAATIHSFVEAGLLPPANNDRFPSWVVQRIIAIQDQLAEGKTIEELKEEIAKERRKFLSQATDLNSMVRVYQKFSSNSFFTFFTSLGVLILLSGLITLSIFDPKNPVLVAGQHSVGAAVAAGKNAARIAVAPLGQTMVTIIKASKPEDNKSSDPLGLTNIEKEKLVIPENILQVDSSGNLNIGSGDITANGFKGSGENLTNLSANEIIGVVSLSTLPWTEISENFLSSSGLAISLDETTNELTFANTDLGSGQLIFKNIAVSGQGIVTSDLNNDTLNFAAGSNVSLTTDPATDTLTIGVNGTVSNADTIDLLDSTAFLRSDTNNSFTSGTLTLNSGTTLSIQGSLSCTDCITDLAVADILTINAGGSVAVAALIGTLTDAQVSDILTVGAGGSVAASTVTGSLTDAQISDTITASSYLLLTGGTVSGATIFSAVSNPGLTIGNGTTGYLKIGDSTISDPAGDLVIDSNSGLTRLADSTLLMDDGGSSSYLLNTRTSAGNNSLAIQNPGLGLLNVAIDGHLTLNGDFNTAQTFLDTANTNTLIIRDGTNTLFSIADVGAVGNASVTGSLNAASNIQTGGTTRIDASGNLLNIGNLTPISSPNKASSSNTITSVDNPANDVGGFTSLAISTDGNPIIAYRDITAGSLKVTKCNDPACTGGDEAITTVEDVANSLATAVSITIGPDGLPVIAYNDATASDLKVVKCGNASCSSGNTITNVDSADSVANNLDLVLGVDGYPVIAYRDATNLSLKFVRCNDSACTGGGETFTQVDNPAENVGRFPSIALGTDGLPVISYEDFTNTSTKVAKCGDMSCSANNILTTVDNTGIEDGYYTSIAIGADGLPVVSWQDDLGFDLKVAKCGNTACSTGNTVTVVDNPGGAEAGWFSSIAIGTDGLPVISHGDNSNASLKVSKCGNPSCTTGNKNTQVDNPANNVGFYTSIAIGNDGNPVISYYDSTAGGLKVIKCGSTDCSVSSASYSGGSNIGTLATHWNNVYAAQFWGKQFQIANYDLAEEYPVKDTSINAGDIVSVSIEGTFVEKSDSKYNNRVLGVISTDPGITLGEWQGSEPTVKVALAGRVPVKVSTENGAIQPGDSLTSSSTPGVAMKATQSGPTIGKALESFTCQGSSIICHGKVMVFVSTGYSINFDETTTYTLQNNSNYITDFISKTGEAVFSKVSATIANFSKLIFGELVVQKSAKSAGQSTLLSGQNEIFIQSDKVHSDSLINLTPDSEPDGVLYVKEKMSGEGFTVGVKRIDQNSAKEIKFNWFILNQE